MDTTCSNYGSSWCADFGDDCEGCPVRELEKEEITVIFDGFKQTKILEVYVTIPDNNEDDRVNVMRSVQNGYFDIIKEDTMATFKRVGRYWNSNGKGIAVVASITTYVNWAAYIGADDGYSEAECCQWTADYGAKLSEEDARHFFPDIDLPYRH